RRAVRMVALAPRMATDDDRRRRYRGQPARGPTQRRRARSRRSRRSAVAWPLTSVGMRGETNLERLHHAVVTVTHFRDHSLTDLDFRVRERELGLVTEDLRLRVDHHPVGCLSFPLFAGLDLNPRRFDGTNCAFEEDLVGEERRAKRRAHNDGEHQAGFIWMS